MSHPPATAPDPVAEGWFAEPESSSPFVRELGQIWSRSDSEGVTRFAFVAAPAHANLHGIIHGGVMLTFADFTIGAIGARLTGNPNAVTLDLNLQFVSSGQVGEFIIGSGRILRRTKTLLFLEGELHGPDRQIAAFTGIWKYMRPRV
ncbi:MAG: PaaI family thioesterase [Flavobacteriaceae bacterium]